MKETHANECFHVLTCWQHATHIVGKISGSNTRQHVVDALFYDDCQTVFHAMYATSEHSRKCQRACCQSATRCQTMLCIGYWSPGRWKLQRRCLLNHAVLPSCSELHCTAVHHTVQYCSSTLAVITTWDSVHSQQTQSNQLTWGRECRRLNFA